MIRQSVQTTAWLAFAANCAPLFAAADKRRFKLGACDWSIGKMGDPGAFEVAKEIGLDGVQVSLGTAADDMRLRKPEVQQQFKEAAKKTGLQVSSLAIGELSAVHPSAPSTWLMVIRWKTILLALWRMFAAPVPYPSAP